VCTFDNKTRTGHNEPGFLAGLTFSPTGNPTFKIGHHYSPEVGVRSSSLFLMLDITALRSLQPCACFLSLDQPPVDTQGLGTYRQTFPTVHISQTSTLPPCHWYGSRLQIFGHHGSVRQNGRSKERRYVNFTITRVWMN
jgi:hypothetical protein